MLFLLKNRKGIAFHGQCIVGLSGPEEWIHVRDNKDRLEIGHDSHGRVFGGYTQR